MDINKFKSQIATAVPVVIDGQIFVACEIATTQDDNDGGVNRRWNVFLTEPDDRTETGQCGYLGQWFDGRFSFWRVGTVGRVILNKGQVQFPEPAPVEKIKLVVVDEHTLAFISPQSPGMGQVLRASVLKGSPYPELGSFPIAFSNVRLASELDFVEYRVDFTGYKNRPNEYEFDGSIPCDHCPLDKKGVYGVPGGSVAGCEGSKCGEARENMLIDADNHAMLLRGVWVDGNAGLRVVKDHPEAAAIDAAFVQFPAFEARTFRVDDEVLYSPGHIGFDMDTQNQFGVVSSVEGTYPTQRVWVRFKGPNGELTPTARLIKRNTVFFEVESQPDGQGRQRFFLYWPADNVGPSVNLCGIRAQIFNANLEEHLDRARLDGNIVLDWADRWF